MDSSIWIRRMQAEMGMPKPLVKWAGGKRQLLTQLLERLPEKWERYHEPFAGGLALFFALSREERLECATLGDLNRDLMDTYRMVRTKPEEVMEVLKSWRHSRRKFEELRAVRRINSWSPEDAARFIYFNKTCFNGLYRVNKKGEFNVPFGKYKNPTICDVENITAVSAAFHNVTLFTGSFLGCIRSAQKGDFVYCDPPYAEVDFTAYTREGFGLKEQKLLADTLDSLNKKRVKWLLSNSDVPWIRKRYKKYKVTGVTARRSINSDAKGRKPVGEVLVQNY